MEAAELPPPPSFLVEEKSMTPDVQGQITSELFRALLESVSADKSLPITVKRCRNLDQATPERNRFNIFVFTDEGQSIPSDADTSVTGVAYKKDGHLYITEDIDVMFLASAAKLSEMFFAPIGALITELPPQP